jgi:hypothetical protein
MCDKTRKGKAGDRITGGKWGREWGGGSFDSGNEGGKRKMNPSTKH